MPPRPKKKKLVDSRPKIRALISPLDIRNHKFGTEVKEVRYEKGSTVKDLIKTYHRHRPEHPLVLVASAVLHSPTQQTGLEKKVEELLLPENSFLFVVAPPSSIFELGADGAGPDGAEQHGAEDTVPESNSAAVARGRSRKPNARVSGGAGNSGPSQSTSTVSVSPFSRKEVLSLLQSLLKAAGNSGSPGQAGLLSMINVAIAGRGNAFAGVGSSTQNYSAEEILTRVREEQSSPGASQECPMTEQLLKSFREELQKMKPQEAWNTVTTLQSALSAANAMASQVELSDRMKGVESRMEEVSSNMKNLQAGLLKELRTAMTEELQTAVRSLFASMQQTKEIEREEK